MAVQHSKYTTNTELYTLKWWVLYYVTYSNRKINVLMYRSVILGEGLVNHGFGGMAMLSMIIMAAHAHCVPTVVLRTRHVFVPHNCSLSGWVLSLPSWSRWGDWGTGRSGDFCKVTQLGHGSEASHQQSGLWVCIWTLILYYCLQSSKVTAGRIRKRQSREVMWVQELKVAQLNVGTGSACSKGYLHKQISTPSGCHANAKADVRPFWPLFVQIWGT